MDKEIALKFLKSFIILVFLSLFVSLPVSADEVSPLWGKLDRGPHQIGFKLFEDWDFSRTYYAKYDYENKKHEGERARPIRVYVWYPAEDSDISAMQLVKYFDLALDDFGPHQETDKKKFRNEIPLARGLTEKSLDALLKKKTAAKENASPKQGKFPLLVFGQGLYYESPITHSILCEYLASHGYVVATCPLIGTYSRLVNLDVVDLETQVRDMEFVISLMRKFEAVDPDKLGLLGFDLGGMSALVLAMRNTDVDAFASLDAGILFSHPSGLPRTSPHYNVERFRIPWIHMTRSEAVENIPQNDAIDFLYETKKYGDSYLLLFDDTRHVDFTSYSMFEIETPVPAYWGPVKGFPQRRYETICKYVLYFFSAYLLDNRKGLDFINKKFDKSSYPEVSFIIEKRSGHKAPPTFDDFIRLIFEDSFSRAYLLFKQAEQKFPDSELYDEAKINLLGYKFLYFWGNVDHAIKIFKLNVKNHPQSFNVYDSLGEAYMVNGQIEYAIKNYEKSLELNPDNTNALEILEQLKKKEE